MKNGRRQTTLEGEQVNVIYYRVGDYYLTEVECLESGNLIARGIADHPEESERNALRKAAQCLVRRRASYLDLMVGG
jgi:hypothetical protein